MERALYAQQRQEGCGNEGCPRRHASAAASFVARWSAGRGGELTSDSRSVCTYMYDVRVVRLLPTKYGCIIVMSSYCKKYTRSL